MSREESEKPMRDRLIELLKSAERKYLSNGTHIPQMAEFFADYLLENGIVCPPCKVGDVVYYITENPCSLSVLYDMMKMTGIETGGF